MTNITNSSVKAWIESVAGELEPADIHWVSGSEQEAAQINQLLVDDGTFTKLNEKEFPNSYWALSDKSDVARVEGRTYICSINEADCGPTNNWREPKEAKEYLAKLMKGCMRGKTMYVVPYLMGPDGSPYSKVGFELTDSPYVVANMRIMARIGEVALKNLPDDSTTDYVRGIHSIGSLDPEERYICHFPETKEIISFNTNYGGNALQGKKCFALRIASTLARDEGWLAEHMLILGITNPDGKKHYVAAAFPSACGKTNLAMLVPPENYVAAGWKIETVGDDIAWLNFGPDGRLYAINPEAGFFGVAPGTSEKTNHNALESLKGNSIFTNTALDLDTMTPWWEGQTEEVPENLKDWHGNRYDKASAEPAAHPNSRFTCPASQCPSLSPEWENPQGVPISAIIFGGRRSKSAPLVYETFDWIHGTFVGVTMASKATAAAEGKAGVLKRDPMAMRPFIGYHAGDYFQHWLDIGKKGGANCPKIYHVNWFRRDDNDNFLWPGFGDNLRVLEWILKRVDGEVDAVETKVGLQPKSNDINIEGLDIDLSVMEQLSTVSKEDWHDEIDSQTEFLTSIGEKLPNEMMEEHRKLKQRLGFYTRRQ